MSYVNAEDEGGFALCYKVVSRENVREEKWDAHLHGLSMTAQLAR
jgi:hypothetical protein